MEISNNRDTLWAEAKDGKFEITVSLDNPYYCEGIYKEFNLDVGQATQLIAELIEFVEECND